jgi:hypothetical protein
MSLEISGDIALAVDVILLTFVFVWKERQKKAKPGTGVELQWVLGTTLSPLPRDE